MTSVMGDPGEIAAKLRGTVLDGLPIEEGLGETWVVTGIESGRLLSAWRAARAAVPATGRWPVVTMVDEQWLDPTSEEVEALARAAQAVDPSTVYRWWGTDSVIEPENLRWHLPHLLGPDVEEQARRELRLPTPLVTIERWAWEHILADTAALEEAWRGAAPLVGTRNWFTPQPEVQIVLLPTPTQWLAPAWFHYFRATEVAADGSGRPALAAAIRRWEQQWGAELVATWGTMTQFVVAKQPALGEEAWQLALQLLALGGNLESPPWELALAVTRSDAWFLHDRP